ncbi:hypothetical protein ACIBQ1_01820 [Nonomuraea sp. NPDC050153]|uniref:hypothetical protein n=1 Tax=Nonomuraea sp. NPDC050153 TaxID=3364359 RepID=UPI0037AE4E94
MRETDLREMLDRATEDTVLPAGISGKVIMGARARRRRSRVAVAGLAVATGGAALAVSLVLVPVTAPPSATTSVSVSARPPADPLSRLGGQLGRPLGPSDVLVYGQAGPETLVVLARQAKEEERTKGGKAAELWAGTDGTPFRRVSDYLSYDFGCVQGDEVCERTRPSGLGFAAVRMTQGRTFVIVSIAPGRTATVTTAEGQSTTVRASGISKTRTARPWEIEIRVSMADGASYVLPLPPGGVVEG